MTLKLTDAEVAGREEESGEVIMSVSVVMRRIPVGRAGHVALIDDADYELVSQYRWFRKTDRQGTIYPRRRLPDRGDGVQHYQLMHQLIVGLGAEHRDRDGLNNQRSNLRVATHAENCANRCWSGGSSQYKGVTWHRRFGKWIVSIGVPCTNGRKQHIGYFTDEEEAAHAYDAVAVSLYGEFAYLNFPNEGGE